jgi:hypothetical protein
MVVCEAVGRVERSIGHTNIMLAAACGLTATCTDATATIGIHAITHDPYSIANDTRIER